MPAISDPLISDSIRNWVEIIAFLAAGCWGVYVFWYKKHYVPSRLPPYLVISTNLQKVGRKGPLRAIRAEFSVINKSKTRVEVLASWYNAIGVNISYAGEDKINDDSPFGKNFIEHLNNDPGPIITRRDITVDNIEVVAVGRLLEEGTWLLPDEEISNRIVFYVSDQFDNLEVHVAIQTARDKEGMHQEWTRNDKGMLQSIIYLKLPGFDAEHRRNRERFDASGSKRHQTIQNRKGLGRNVYVGLISLWD